MSAQTGRREPQRWGRYELISQIATGPLGPLWVARATTGPEMGRVVFVRRIVQGPVVSEGILDELRNAALVATDVRHPKLAAVLDTVFSERELSIVSEYLEGEVLRALLRRAAAKSLPLSTPVALRLGLDLVDAVIGARDAWALALEGTAAVNEPRLASAVLGGLCADNVLITSYGEAIVLDVGLWGTARRHTTLSHHPDAMSHAAPEQLGPEPWADERSDVFSIGVMIWEMLANRPLFAAPNWSRFSVPSDDPTPPAQHPLAASLRRKILEAPIARLDAVVRAGSRVEREAADLVARALSRNPDDRYSSLAEMKAALESYGQLASEEAISDVVGELAATSLEARRAALAEVMGQTTARRDERLDSARPTVPPDFSATNVKAEALEARPREEKKVRLPLPSGKPRTTPEGGPAAHASPEESGTHATTRRTDPNPESSPEPRPGRKKPPLPPRRKRGGGTD